MSPMVFAVFDDRSRAETAVREARALPECARGCLAVLHDGYDPANPSSVHRLRLRETDAPRGVAIGGSVGAVTGAVLGWVLAVPVGFLHPIGAVPATIAGIVIGAGFGAVMAGLFGSAAPAKPLQRLLPRLGPARILVSIETRDRRARDRVAELLRQRGGDVD